MALTDPVSDLIVRIKTAIARRKAKVDIPSSRIKEHIVRIMKEEGYIANYKYIADSKQGILRVYLKYSSEKESVIQEMRRVSKPGLRIYRGHEKIPKIYGGMGIAIVSTSQGLMTDAQCRQNRIGGEVLCSVW